MRQNEKGLRYRMNRNKKEADEVGRLAGLPGMTINLPIIGETYIGPPKVASIWEGETFCEERSDEDVELSL